MPNGNKFESLKMMAGGQKPNRREFLKFCGVMATFIGMGPAFAPQIAHALTTKKRPS